VSVWIEKVIPMTEKEKDNTNKPKVVFGVVKYPNGEKGYYVTGEIDFRR
jgi:hypothetical protein